MKLDRLTWTSRITTRQLPEEGHAVAKPSLSPVASASDTEPDRQRTLQQEMEEIEAKAIGPFEGKERVMQSALEVAEKLAGLGNGATQLVRADKVHSRGFFIDED